MDQHRPFSVPDASPADVRPPLGAIKPPSMASFAGAPTSGHSFATVSGSLAEQLARSQAALAQAEQRNTELRRALDDATYAAQTATARLATFASYLPEGLLLVDPRGTVALINDYCCNAFGLPLPASNWLGYSIRNIANWLQEQTADPTGFQLNVQQHWQSGQQVLNQELLMLDGRTLAWDYLPTSEAAQDAVASIGFLLRLRDVTEVRQQREQQQHERTFYETVLNQLPAEVFATDAATHYTFLNAQAAAYPGLRKGFAADKSAPYLGDVQQQRQRYYEQVATTGLPVKWIEQSTDADVPRYFMRSLQPVKTEDGRLQMIVGHSVDITLQEEARQRLQEQEAFYNAILNHMPADISVFDAAHRYRFVNNQAVRDPDLREWLIGKDNFQYFLRQQRSRTMAEQRHFLFEEAVRNRRQMSWEETAPRPDGTLSYWLYYYYPVFGADGSLDMVISYGADITARRQAEDRIRASEHRVRALLTALPDTILVTSRMGFVHDAKLGDDSLLSQAADQLIGNHLADVLPPLAAEPVLASLTEMLRTGQRTDTAFELAQPDGARVAYQVRCTPLDSEEALLVLTSRKLPPLLGNTDLASRMP
ncbi:PAS domain-containing protein [Hymenobacter sp. GOD-10R]|uniref:PAS domain-containing protein n=1 Tax=Hymenobacter sp. GOD-10R TaxID=3093922 RepID=UPI002D76CBA7|nr:PAS domain-containing protein [Hymenobacter sp. GOD-10R]WRQ28752.1 PAS domain-containing protein [Hymenobacter sp. GOD-10R]